MDTSDYLEASFDHQDAIEQAHLAFTTVNSGPVEDLNGGMCSGLTFLWLFRMSQIFSATDGAEQRMRALYCSIATAACLHFQVRSIKAGQVVAAESAGFKFSNIRQRLKVESKLDIPEVARDVAAIIDDSPGEAFLFYIFTAKNQGHVFIIWRCRMESGYRLFDANYGEYYFDKSLLPTFLSGFLVNKYGYCLDTYRLIELTEEAGLASIFAESGSMMMVI